MSDDKDSLLIKAFTLTSFALFAKFKVDKVYWKLNVILDTVAIIIVFELPSKESFNKNVRFELLYGM